MEFDKKPSTETDKHVEGEAPKKVRKKRKTKETQPSAKKVIKAPVPAEILAEEHKKTKETKDNEEKPKKAKKKTKKSAVAGAVSAPASAEAPLLDGANEKPKRRKRPRKETGEAAPQEIDSGESTDFSKEDLPDTETAAEARAFTEVENPYEVTILPREADEEEGELFLSERWQKKNKQSVPQSTGETREVEAELTDEDTTQPTTKTRRSVTSSRASDSKTPAAAVPAAANRAPDYRRSAERRNLVAGILLGGVIEHIRHKRREKRMKNAHENEVKQLKNEQQFQQSEQLKNERKAARTKTALEKQLERLSGAVGIKPEKNSRPAQEAMPQPPEAAAAANETLQASKPATSRAENLITTGASLFYEEYKQKFRAPEAAAAVAATSRVEQQPNTKKTHEKPAPVPKQQPENIDQPIEVSPDRRVETSAWHRIEVDKKTGKAVENPELAYGAEFQNEQHQEQLRRQIAEASMDSEQVKRNYMPMVDKTASTSVETHDAPRRQAPQKPPKVSSASDMIQNLRNQSLDGHGIDIVLWIVLFFIVMAIIALLL